MTKRAKRSRLTAKRTRFAERYAGPGDGVRAAKAAGYHGAARALAVRASECLEDERVRERIRERGVKMPARPSPGATAPAGPTLDTSSPMAFYRELAADASLPLRDRQRAMERIEAAEGKSTGSVEDAFERQRAKVLEVLRQTMDAAGVARRVRTMLRHARDPAVLELLKRMQVEVEKLAGER